MNTDLKKEFYNKLRSEKTEINLNKNPIKMAQFLPFLTVEVEIIKDAPGSDFNWTRWENKSIGLIIRGGIVGGVEYLDSLQFGVKLSNQYNNYVNPFYLFDILTEQGKAFFVDYYKAEIKAIVESNEQKVVFMEKQLAEQKLLFASIKNEVKQLKSFKP